VQRAVEWGLARKERRIPEYIGVDEKAFFLKRHRYETLVCDLKEGTVEYVDQGTLLAATRMDS